MNDLIEFVLEQHGGADRWRALKGITATVEVSGPFWPYKGQPDLLGRERVQVSTAEQRIEMSPFGADERFSFDASADRVTIGTDEAERVVLERPRSTMLDFTGETKWSAAQTGYFISYATWMYLLEPLLFTLPGVESYELEPWHEDGETWRRLEVHFPPSIATHNPVQTYYFDAKTGLQRRMDYVVLVNGKSDVAHYTSEHREFDGLILPTRRRVLQRTPANIGDHSFAGILLDVSDVQPLS